MNGARWKHGRVTFGMNIGLAGEAVEQKRPASLTHILTNTPHSLFTCDSRCKHHLIYS